MRLYTKLICVFVSIVSSAVPVMAQSARGSLIVLLTVDQMRADYLDRFGTQFKGGLRRLTDGGSVFTNAYQDHGITETAPGHAATLSGRFPVHTAIVRNADGVNDVPNAEVIGAPEEPAASPIRFRGTTLLDWLKTANSNTRFLSVARKDRGAILPIGQSKGPVYWWAGSTASFTTSRYYADTLPAWVQQFNARHLGERYAGSAWNLLLPDAAYPEPDSVPAENRGRNFTFPHLAPSDSNVAARSAGAFPWMDQMTLAFALEGVERLGLGQATDRTDLLAVSLSTTDAIGHAYGPDSREVHDQLLRLDQYLGVFLDSLFKLRDQNRVLVVLTSDHGVSPFPAIKSNIDKNQDAKVVSLASPFSEFQGRLTAMGVDSTAVALEGALVLVTKPELFQRRKINADSAIESFGREVSKIQGVLRADLLTTLARSDTVHDDIARRWLHMFNPGGPVRLVITLTPFSYRAPASYPTHGSPHDVDAHVPLVFYGPGVRRARFAEQVRVVDIAPTLAALVGVKPLERIDGRVLKEVVP